MPTALVVAIHIFGVRVALVVRMVSMSFSHSSSRKFGLNFFSHNLWYSMYYFYVANSVRYPEDSLVVTKMAVHHRFRFLHQKQLSRFFTVGSTEISCQSVQCSPITVLAVSLVFVHIAQYAGSFDCGRCFFEIIHLHSTGSSDAQPSKIAFCDAWRYSRNNPRRLSGTSLCTKSWSRCCPYDEAKCCIEERLETTHSDASMTKPEQTCAPSRAIRRTCVHISMGFLCWHISE